MQGSLGFSISTLMLLVSAAYVLYFNGLQLFGASSPDPHPLASVHGMEDMEPSTLSCAQGAGSFGVAVFANSNLIHIHAMN